MNGEVIALDPENSDEVAGAVKALLAQNRPAEAAARPTDFDAAIERFRAASETLRSFEEELDCARAQAVAAELAKLLSAAAGWGMEVRVEEPIPLPPGRHHQ